MTSMDVADDSVLGNIAHHAVKRFLEKGEKRLRDKITKMRQVAANKFREKLMATG